MVKRGSKYLILVLRFRYPVQLELLELMSLWYKIRNKNHSDASVVREVMVRTDLVLKSLNHVFAVVPSVVGAIAL